MNGIARYTFGAGDEYEIRVAGTIEERRDAWALVYEAYREEGYAAYDPSGLWYSSYDALPDTTTFVVYRKGRAVAALSLVFDSPLGLPADELYGEELNVLRARGRLLCEIVSLASRETARARCLETLQHLFKLGWLTARHVERATDFVITVNPHHAAYYRRKLLFTRTGREKAYRKVGGAPAVLLRLDLETAQGRYREKYGTGDDGLFRFFVDPTTQNRWLAFLRAGRAKLNPAVVKAWLERRRRRSALVTT